MDTSRYKAFLTAADTGSLKKAADTLGYTPSGVSQLVKALEEELDIILLQRGKKGVTLTQEGSMLLPIIRELLLQESRLFQLSADMKGLAIGNINVASYHCLAAVWMPELISGFCKKYPGIRIKLLEGTQQGIMGYLDAKIADVAFFNDSQPMNYDWIPLMEDRMLAVLPQNHPLAGETVFPIEAFRHERFIMPEHGEDYDVFEILDQFQITPDIYLSTFDSFTAIAMVGKGLGVSLMNEISIQDWRKDIIALPTEPPYVIKMGIALPSLNNASPSVRKFVEYAVEILTKAL
ncbi:LysR family transcriptional regulator [Aminipila butyrica]|uniref:LysR family transcriptional regulator n=1 Tax=Aminipila butyrica TaxID=433296 RepID=A0A858BZ06_9FIRM|nr:LysR family transcriptional regulator [Aminipila butyrica]QIB70338.1 LysR family transcriptional regulator [Aminipila butyrica]